MRKRNLFLTLVLAVLTAVPQGMVAQQPTASTESEAQDVSYTLGKTKNSGRAGMPKMHRQSSGRLLKERRNVKNDLLQKQAPVQITSEQLRAAKAKASRRQGFKVPYTPDNNHKHVIVNVIYNSMDETMDEGLFDLDVVTGELTFLSGNFIEDYENYGFNGGGYIFNGKYRGVYYDSDYNVDDAHHATVMEFDMDTWEPTEIFDIPYMSTMALETATQYNADGTTTVLGQFWRLDREGNLSLRYATLDANGTTTTSFGQDANKHMLAMGVTSDGRLYGVAKDGYLYKIDRTTGEEICVGHTGIDDIVDYEGNFWLQAGEIDPRDNTFYWMAEHASNFWTQLLSVDLTTGKATSLIDFAGDVECAGMVIARQQRKDDTPASVSDLTVAFGPLATTGTGSFVAPTTNFVGEQLDANAVLYYNLYVNDVKQTVTDNQAKPGATVNYSFNATNILFNSKNVVRVTISAAETGEQEFIIDADVDNDLAEVWNYYLNRGQVVCGVTSIDDQFGADYGQTWNIFSAFNGSLTTKLGKVAVADLTSPVFGFDIILEDTSTGMEVEINGPEGKQVIVPLTVMDGVQHINIPLDEYKSWGWVQPNLKATFNIAYEGDRIHDIYVDNIGIYDLQPCNLTVTSMKVPTELKAGEQAIVNVTVMNLGQQPAKNYTVTLFEDEVPVESQTFANPTTQSRCLPTPPSTTCPPLSERLPLATSPSTSILQTASRCAATPAPPMA